MEICKTDTVRMIMNEVRKLYNNDGCVLKEASSNDYES